MKSKTYSAFFAEATKRPDLNPYDYQCRLACGSAARFLSSQSLSSGRPCESLLIDIPTGLGKTAAAILAWLWNRHALRSIEWPRRLVYCLPMRTLVEQTADNAREWIKNLVEAGVISSPSQPPVHVLMGGEETDEWDIHPEREAILIGTQDMLLSRALNRGYGMSRYRWPMHFGLLNNDCLWILDETQLMGVGVETSAQLNGFRQVFSTFRNCSTWWMSATLAGGRLATIDNPTPPGGWTRETLTAEERDGPGRPRELFTSRKVLSKASVTLSTATSGNYAKELGRFILQKHSPHTLTLVIVNRVQRAQEIYEALKKTKSNRKLALVHSRFRPVDRKSNQDVLFEEGDRIVIATQAVEAGVDVSARFMISELAPWSSLVQRFGRCNRRAEPRGGEIVWIDIQPKDASDKLLLPYTEPELKKAREAIAQLTEASPKALSEVSVQEEVVIRPVIRRRDLVDLFDTTPDLCGQDIDISRYIRDGDDSDVQFFWRKVAGDAPTADELPPDRNEICRVSVGDARNFLKKAEKRIWSWDPLNEEWRIAGNVRPGAVYLVDAAKGGYSDELGWTGDPKDKPTPHPPQEKTESLETYSGDEDSFSRKYPQREWQTIQTHTQFVVGETNRLWDDLSINGEIAEALGAAALWHDVGKAHDQFQRMLHGGAAERIHELWAKSDNIRSYRDPSKYRPGFRHELASALAWLLAGAQNTAERDLIAYLIAAHHGKVRLSIRSLPNEITPPDDRLFARGVWQDDILPPVNLGTITTPQIRIDLSFMKMGEGPNGPSWLARAVALRDRFGPFQLAYFETLLRAADARASRML